MPTSNMATGDGPGDLSRTRLRANLIPALQPVHAALQFNGHGKDPRYREPDWMEAHAWPRQGAYTVFCHLSFHMKTRKYEIPALCPAYAADSVIRIL